jgi:hypothetical protein
VKNGGCTNRCEDPRNSNFSTDMTRVLAEGQFATHGGRLNSWIDVAQDTDLRKEDASRHGDGIKKLKESHTCVGRTSMLPSSKFAPCINHQMAMGGPSTAVEVRCAGPRSTDLQHLSTLFRRVQKSRSGEIISRSSWGDTSASSEANKSLL